MFCVNHSLSFLRVCSILFVAFFFYQLDNLEGKPVSEAVSEFSTPAVIDYTQPVFLSGHGWGAFQLLGESSKGEPRVQQDRMLIIEDWFGGLLCVLCDGHGKEGHVAAQLVIDELPHLLARHDFHLRPHFSLVAICRVLDRLIKEVCDGGTTFSLVYLRESAVFVGTVGDTRVCSMRRKAVRMHIREHRLDLAPSHELIELRRRGGRLRYKDTTPFHHSRDKSSVEPGSKDGSSEEPKKRKRTPFVVSQDGRTMLPLYRALGNRRYGDALSYKPETTAITWDTLEHATHLILWVDGVWETLDEAVVPTSLIRNWINAGGRGVRQGTQMLAQNLQMFCPSDNASAIIIDLAHFRPSY